MVQEFLNNIAGINETRFIYQDIVDSVYKQEIQKIIDDDIFKKNLAIQKDVYTQKSTMIQIGMKKLKDLIKEELKNLEARMKEREEQIKR